MEHEDIHKGCGHLYVLHNRPAIAPLGESRSNAEIFRGLAKAMGIDRPELQASDEELIRTVLEGRGPTMLSASLESLRDRGFVRLDVPAPHLPYARGARLDTPTGKIEIASTVLAERGVDPLPSYIPPYESEERDPELARRFPLALISPPAHAFLNSTFVNVAWPRRSAGKPALEIHGQDAASRGIRDGARVAIYNDRGRFTAEAVVTDRVRPGVVSAPSVWWGKLTEDGTNANQTTSQALTDIGRGATFYDNLVDVAPI